MGKLIIDNRTEISDFDALCLIQKVVSEGRISNGDRQYCYLTVFHLESGEYSVSTDLNKKSDRFMITHRKKK